MADIEAEMRRLAELKAVHQSRCSAQLRREFSGKAKAIRLVFIVDNSEVSIGGQRPQPIEFLAGTKAFKTIMAECCEAMTKDEAGIEKQAARLVAPE